MTNIHMTVLHLTDKEVTYINLLILGHMKERQGDLLTLIKAKLVADDLFDDLSLSEQNAFKEKMKAAHNAIDCGNPNCTLHHPPEE